MSRPEHNEGPLPPGLGTTDSETLRRAIAVVRALRDPALPGLVFLLSLIIVGWVALAVTVFEMAEARFVPLQTPHLVSGAFGGAALLTVGALLAAVQAERRDRAQAVREMQQTVDAVTALVRTATHGRHGRNR